MMKNSSKLIFLLAFSASLMNCKGTTPVVTPEPPVNDATPVFVNLSIQTDKAVYNPGDQVTLSMDTSILPAGAKVRYKYQNTLVSEALVNSPSWTWQTPSDDFRGYIAEVYADNNGMETIYATTGIDVSSDWTKFPRYGFLSKYGMMSTASSDSVISYINRLHINGLQFYDWQNKHHMPLPMSGGTPLTSWPDIAGRTNYLSTIQQYINSAHAKGIKAMFYDLVYGAWENAEADGVSPQWYIYNDNTHTNRDFFALSSPFLSNLYLLDPGNTGWQNYMVTQTQNVYNHTGFDGYHMDQVGDRGIKYRYDGSTLTLSSTFESFIDAIHAATPGKFNVMNAVAQYGQQGIAASSTNFLYTEVWSPADSYNDLANLIKQNNTLSNNTKNTVLAAYMNYDMGGAPGYFNTPSVLMTDAVIFAFGGAHIEMGEHMLCREYFPNDNLVMKDDLKRSLINYYDFAVAYENLLRDGGTFNTIDLTTLDSKIALSAWPASQGKVAVFGKLIGTKQIIHLINFTNSTTQKWRDNTGIQVMPALISNSKVAFTATDVVKNIWIASPDFDGGASRKLNFAQLGNRVSFIVPELRYWDMIVVEY